ncbi:MAG: hypothetical protein AB8C84_05895 [Oligoflexales bacterium]
MRRTGSVKFPSSMQLFKFCHKVLVLRSDRKVHDQEVGQILGFSPSDCSHWKRGEKNVRSIFALEKLAHGLVTDIGLIHDLAVGHITLDEAWYEYTELSAQKQIRKKVLECVDSQLQPTRTRVLNFVHDLLGRAEAQTPPLYLPEVFRYFSFIQTQTADIFDRLTRVLRTKPGHYTLQVRKGDIRAHARMSMVRDLARIVFEAERSQFPELGELDREMLEYEKMLFTAALLVPMPQLMQSLVDVNPRRDLAQELSQVFWAPRSLVNFQLQEAMSHVNTTEMTENQKVPSHIAVEGTRKSDVSLRQ